jgi:hypothetical protein
MTLPSALILFPSLLLGLTLPTPAKEATKEPAKNVAVPRAQVQRVEADCQSITAALQMYKLNAGDYPPEKQGLSAGRKTHRSFASPALGEGHGQGTTRCLGSRIPPASPDEKRKPVLVIASGGPDLEALNDDIEIPVEKPEPKK